MSSKEIALSSVAGGLRSALKPKDAVTSERKQFFTVAPRRLRDLTRRRQHPPVIRSKPTDYGHAFGRGFRINSTLPFPQPKDFCYCSQRKLLQVTEWGIRLRERKGSNLLYSGRHGRQLFRPLRPMSRNSPSGRLRSAADVHLAAFRDARTSLDGRFSHSCVSCTRLPLPLVSGDYDATGWRMVGWASPADTFADTSSPRRSTVITLRVAGRWHRGGRIRTGSRITVHPPARRAPCAGTSETQCNPRTPCPLWLPSSLCVTALGSRTWRKTSPMRAGSAPS